jgi:tetratricopeptide (TPR) repeat protein
MGLLLYGLIFALVRREVLLGIGLAWTVFLLSPGIAVTVFDLIWSKAAERYTYAPSAGLLIVFAWFALKGLEKLPTTPRGTKRKGWITASVLLSVWVGLWGWDSFHRNRVWQSPEIFWQAALAATTQKGFPDRQLGHVYEGLGRYEEAEEFYRKAITFWEEASGKERDRFLDDVLLDLAELYFFQHRYAEAEPLYKRVLALRENDRGKMDYAVATSLDNLARLYYTQDRYAEAEPLYRRSLMILEKTRGPVHPDTATSLNNLAVLVQAQNRTAEAEELYQRSLAIREKSLRADHPDLAASLENYASLLRKMNRQAEAARMEARAEMIRNRQP